MNIGKWFEQRSLSVPVYTWLWVFGSLSVSYCFALHVFPRLVEPQATIFLQTKMGNDVVYWPNSLMYRKQFLALLADDKSLYYTACSFVPPSAECDQTKNWIKLDPQEVGCTDVTNCTKETFYVATDMQSAALTHHTIVSVSGKVVAAKDPKTVSLSDPAGWGDRGKWPVFFIVLFFATKLGRSMGELIFTPYSR